ncbi:MAG: hypothetical protein V3R68_05580 [Gammaproteobacteria bacterium]
MAERIVTHMISVLLQIDMEIVSGFNDPEILMVSVTNQYKHVLSFPIFTGRV